MAVDFSIVMGRVSTEDSGRVLEALDALRAQTGAAAYEVVIVDRRQDAITDRLERDYPEVTLVRCAPGTPLPAMRTEGLHAARGTTVIVTEDHCVPGPNWLEAFQNALDAAPEDALAVGGCVENGVTGTSLDWATFLCEYSGSLAPVPEGESNDVPGMNVAYRRAAFQSVDDAVLRKGFWETTLHPVLREQGKTFFSSNAIVLNHCKKFSLRLFCRQRFVYSRYYAGIRFPRESRLKRYVAALLSLALPPLLLWRMTRHILSKKRLRGEFVSASPYLVLFTLIWAAGEMVGYVAGPKDALAEIE